MLLSVTHLRLLNTMRDRLHFSNLDMKVHRFPKIVLVSLLNAGLVVKSTKPLKYSLTTKGSLFLAETVSKYTKRVECNTLLTTQLEFDALMVSTANEVLSTVNFLQEV